MRKPHIFAACAVAIALSISSCANPTDEGEKQQQGSDNIVDTVEEDADIAAMVPDDIASSGRFTVSINPDVEPVKFLDADGELTGLNPDLLRAAASVMGVEAEFQTGTFDSMVPGLESKRYDVIASVGDFVERQKHIDFIDYLKTGDGIIVSAALADEIKSPTDLCGYKMGFARGTSQQANVEATAKKCEKTGQEPLEVNSYQDSSAGILSVRSGQADAYWGDLPQMRYNAVKNPDVFELVHESRDSIYGIGINKDDAELRDALRAALRKLADEGVYDELLKQWEQEGYGLPAFPMNADVSCKC